MQSGLIRLNIRVHGAMKHKIECSSEEIRPTLHLMRPSAGPLHCRAVGYFAEVASFHISRIFSINYIDANNFSIACFESSIRGPILSTKYHVFIMHAKNEHHVLLGHPGVVRHTTCAWCGQLARLRIYFRDRKPGKSLRGAGSTDLLLGRVGHHGGGEWK